MYFEGKLNWGWSRYLWYEFGLNVIYFVYILKVLCVLLCYIFMWYKYICICMYISMYECYYSCRYFKYNFYGMDCFYVVEKEYVLVELCVW